MDSSDLDTTQEPAGMVTPPESLAIAPRRVGRYELASPEARAQKQTSGTAAGAEPGSWRTLGPIVFDAPSELSPPLEHGERGNPLSLVILIAAVVATLMVLALTAFLVPGPAAGRRLHPKAAHAVPKPAPPGGRPPAALPPRSRPE